MADIVITCHVVSYSYNGMPLTLHYTLSHTMLQCYTGPHLSWATARSRLMWGTFFCLKVQQKQHQMLRGYHESLLLDHLQPLDVLVENKDVKNVTPLAGSAGKEEENGNKGQEQQTPGEIHSEAHCSSTAALTFILHTSETSCLVSTNCGVDIRAVNRPSQSFTGWL